jgi:hypothetical protein
MAAVLAIVFQALNFLHGSAVVSPGADVVHAAPADTIVYGFVD